MLIKRIETHETGPETFKLSPGALTLRVRDAASGVVFVYAVSLDAAESQVYAEVFPHVDNRDNMAYAVHFFMLERRGLGRTGVQSLTFKELAVIVRQLHESLEMVAKKRK